MNQEKNRRAPGALWRFVVNFWTAQPQAPESLLPLIVAIRGLGVSGFIERLDSQLDDARFLEELREEWLFACAGFRVWTQQQDTIVAWARRSEWGFDAETVAQWWLYGDESSELVVHANERGAELLPELDFGPYQDVVNARLQRLTARGRGADVVAGNVLTHLRWCLPWLMELNGLTDLAQRTWSPHPSNPKIWTSDDVAFVDEYYRDQELVLVAPAEEAIDPFTLVPLKVEQGVGFGPTGLRYCWLVVMRATIIDFMDEILDYGRFHGIRVTLRCVECGEFAPRNPRGYGQLYCSTRCKKRAAKRRYRTGAEAPLSLPLPSSGGS